MSMRTGYIIYMILDVLYNIEHSARGRGKIKSEESNEYVSPASTYKKRTMNTESKCYNRYAFNSNNHLHVSILC